MTTIFTLMLKHTLSDKISLFYAILFPLGMMAGISYFVDSQDYLPFLLTGIISMSILFWSMQGLAFQIYRQKSKGVYQLLKITPMKLTEFIAIMMIVRTLVAFVINILLLVGGFYFFNINFTAMSVIQCAGIILASSLCFSAIGFFISNVAKNEGQINAFSNILFLPMIFCTEAFYSLQSVPNWINAIGKCLPFHYVITSFRAAIGVQDGSVLIAITIILGFTILFFILTLFTSVNKNPFIHREKLLSKNNI
ncbi:ABC transporter permease [Solibacillus sp. FSL H8-0538]|uniref:ABC transporter permease n=1 Tax=Solibacillus sp. FSL H8-0538 TaxID=2921400 RepID=UPI0030F904C5